MKWCLVRHLNPADYNPTRITKFDNEFAKKIDFKDINVRVKARVIRKTQRKNFIGINVSGYENKGKYPVYVSKKHCENKHFDLLMIGKGEKEHYAHIKDFSTFLYDYILHRWRKHFCRYCLKVFRIKEKLKC